MKSGRKKEFFTFQMMYVLFSLYVLRPPLRGGDYKNVHVVKALPVADRREQELVDRDPETGEVENYFDTSNNVFVFQDYKTSHMYHQVWFGFTQKELPNTLGKRAQLLKVIKESLDMFPRKYLICSASNKRYINTSNLFKKLSAYLGVKVTANMLRHSFVTYQYKTKNIKEKLKLKLGRLMLHTANTAQQNYLQETV